MSAILQGVAAMQGNPLRYKARHGTADPFYFHNGLPYEADGALATFTGPPDHFHQGLPFSANGRLCRIGASDPDYFGSGAAPFSASRLNDIPSAAPSHYSSGVGYNISTIGGRVAYENLPAVSYYAFNGTTQFLSIPAWECLGNPAIYETISYQAPRDDGFVIGDTRAITQVGLVDGNYHQGTLANLYLTDSSPLQGRPTTIGNITREGQIPLWTANGNFDISFDTIRANVGTTSWDPIGNVSSDWRIRIYDTTNAGNPNRLSVRINAVESIWFNILENIALGQHFSVRVKRTGAIIELWLDGVSQGTRAADTGPFLSDVLYNTMPNGAALGNVSMTGEGVESRFYPIDEGVGTDIIDTISGQNGTAVPGAVWEVQPDNSRYYPMDDGSPSTTMRCLVDGVVDPALVGTIQNYSDNWT